MTRPVYGITVLRYEDGRVEIREGAFRDNEPWESSALPTDWRLRHAMLIDACEVVKREAGVEPAFRPTGTIAPAESEGR